MSKENYDVEFEGEPVKLGKKTYIIAGLSFAQAERLAPVIDEIGKNQGKTLNAKLINNICVVLHAAISRNYPNITLEEVKDLVDLKNAQKVFGAVMGASGFEIQAGN